MIELDVKINREQVAQLQRYFGRQPGRLNSIQRRSINYAANGVKKEIGKDVSKDVNIKQRDARKAVSVYRATSSRLSALVRVTGRRIPLEDFKARDLKSGGLSYTISKGNRKRIKNAFKKDFGSGRQRVYRPKETGKGIIRLFGPSVVKVVEDLPGYQPEALGRRVGARLEAAIAMNIEKELNRR